jgi:hypothetical protein
MEQHWGKLNERIRGEEPGWSYNTEFFTSYCRITFIASVHSVWTTSCDWEDTSASVVECWCALVQLGSTKVEWDEQCTKKNKWPLVSAICKSLWPVQRHTSAILVRPRQVPVMWLQPQGVYRPSLCVTQVSTMFLEINEVWCRTPYVLVNRYKHFARN